MTATPRQPKALRPRKMWASQPKDCTFEVYNTKAAATNYGDYPGEAFPVLVLPLDPASVSGLRIKIAKAISGKAYSRIADAPVVDRVLAAIGVKGARK